MQVDELVMLKDEAKEANLGLKFSIRYRITKIVDGQYLALDKGIQGMLYHKKFFVSVGMAKAKYICLTVPHDQPWMRVGDIFEGVHNGKAMIHIITPSRSCYVRDAGFSKVRNWDEAKHVYDMMHQANIENALKFVDWNDDNKTDAGDSEGKDQQS